MAGMQWWTVPKLMATGRGDVQEFIAVQAATKPANAIGGPYATQAEAEKAIIAHNSQPPKLPNPLSGIDRAGAVLEAFYKNLTDGKMWRSLGWIALGIVLIIAGIMMWMKAPQKAAALARGL